MKDRSIPGAVWAVFALAVVATASAHHIRGIPHYTYSENYPTAPSFEEVRTTRQLVLRLTYYEIPGTQSVDLALYAKRVTGGKPYEGVVRYAVYADNEDPASAHSVEAYRNKNNIYKAGWDYETDGVYRIRVRIGDDGELADEVFAIQIGRSGPNWVVLGLVCGGVLALIVAVACIKRLQAGRERPRQAKGDG